MATGAVGGQAEEGRDRVRDHVIAVEQAGFLLVYGALAQLDMADEIPRPGGDEPRRDNRVRVARVEYVPSDLFLDKAIVPLVLIERADDVIAVRPRVIAAFVLVVTMRVAVVDDVEPVPTPALAVARRGEQPVDQLLVSPRR